MSIWVIESKSSHRKDWHPIYGELYLKEDEAMTRTNRLNEVTSGLRTKSKFEYKAVEYVRRVRHDNG